MNENEFVEICSERKFWQWLKNRSVFKYKQINKNFDKKEFLSTIFKTIKKRTYYPSPPEEYLTINKGFGVLRVVPILSLKDLCVYYFCVRKLEEYIAVNRVEGTFGGFGIGGSIRHAEEQEIVNMTHDIRTEVFENETYTFKNIDGYDIPSVFNPKAWQAVWGDFNDKIYKYSFEFEEKIPNGVIAEIDISNFYDSVQLDNLEYKVRGCVSTKENEIVYLLFHFLKFWNRHINFYRQQGAGLPQDSFGECSRILANFYLQSYDKNLSEYCKSLNAEYFRYADDQVIFARNFSDLEKIISKASSLLLREGLNINQKKVTKMSFKTFRQYYGFDDFMDLSTFGGRIPSKDTLERKISLYLQNKNQMRKNGVSLLRRIINLINKHKILPSNLKKLKKDLLATEFLTSGILSPNDLYSIHSIITKNEQKKMLKVLEKYSQRCLYSNYLYELKSFLKKIKYSTKNINTQIKRAKSLYDFKIL